MITTIKEWKEFKVNETKNSKNVFVGIHCSTKSLKSDDFYGTIIDEYYMTFKQILEVIQFDYVDAKILLNKVKDYEDEKQDSIRLDDDSIDLVFEIVDFFSENNIEWIFVSKEEALTKYGENCYNVYFKDMHNVYSIDDELTDNSEIYIYNSKINKPILKPI